MQLKTYLKKSLRETIDNCESGIIKAKSKLKYLKNFRTKYALYTIKLRSLWEKDGEKNTETIHKGRLEDAIKEAESQFKATNNNRSDVQADYRVSINIKGDDYLIPKEFWEQYKEKH
jgi:hypothetical protein